MRVAGVVWLLGSAGRLGFVVARRARPLWGGVFRGTFGGKGHTGKCSPKRDLRFGVLRTALGAISNKNQQKPTTYAQKHSFGGLLQGKLLSLASVGDFFV